MIKTIITAMIEGIVIATEATETGAETETGIGTVDILGMIDQKIDTATIDLAITKRKTARVRDPDLGIGRRLRSER